MADLLAQGYITIAVVNDGYSLSLTTSSVSIPANHDGSNPDLSCAYTHISLSKGNTNQQFEITNITPSDNGIKYSYVANGPYAWKVSITELASNITSGYLNIVMRTSDGHQASAKFNFSVIRNIASIDWIKEWNGTRNQIGSNYVITPKIFAGHKAENGKITGIYFGKLKGFVNETLPLTMSDAGEGLYGYQDDKIIFYIANDGAKIGGWDITQNSIQCSDGTLTIKSEGVIASQSKGQEHWALKKDGSASFANGKVRMDALGNASFDGRIVARSGALAGWLIGSQSIYKDGVAINSARRFIAAANVVAAESKGDQFDWVKQYGGVAMYYISNADYGFVGYKGNKLMFASGSRNFIAGWNFDESALCIGTKNNNLGQFTQDASSITIGTNGIRGYKFYLDKNGAGALAGGNIIWDETGKVTFSKNVSLQWSVGIENAQNLAKQANAAAKEAQNAAKLAGDKYGQLIGTYLTRIGTNGIYTGTLAADQIVSGTMSTANIKQAKDKWSLNQDGSGILANGNISWDQDGNVTFGPNVTLSWTNVAQQAANAAKNEAVSIAKKAAESAKTEAINTAKTATDAAKNEAISTAKQVASAAKNEAISSAQKAADAAKTEAISITQKAVNAAKTEAISTTQNAINTAKTEAINAAKAATDAAKNEAIGTAQRAAESAKNAAISSAQKAINAAKSEAISTAQKATDTAKNEAIGTAKKAIESAKIEAIDTAKTATDAAKNEAISSAKRAADAAKNEAIDRAQKAADAAKNEAIGKAQKAIDTAKNEAISSAKQVADAAKNEAISTAKRATDAAKNEAISSAQKAAESAKNTAISTAQRAVDAAKNEAIGTAKKVADAAKNEAISTAKKATDIAEAAAKELASAMALGKMLYRDPTFVKGTNNVVVYNNTSNSKTVTITRSSSSTVPNDSGQMLTIQNTGTASPNCGGFTFATACGYRKVFITRIIAKIPVGRDIAFHSNDLGPGGMQKWLTSTKGTGDWQEYICKVQCGTSKFSSTNCFSITGSFNVTWYLAYATVFDVTTSERYTTTIDANGIYTGSINANQITAGSINADRIAAGCITTSKIAVNAITSDRIAANAIKATHITANSITTDKIASNAITGNKIAAHTITSEQINADSIKANIINTNYINGLTCTFTKGTIGGWTIGTNNISKNNVSLGSDGTISNGANWALKNDGSGFLAQHNITWDNKGSMQIQTASIESSILQNVKIIGTIRQPWKRSGIHINLKAGANSNEILTFDNISCGAAGGEDAEIAANLLSWNISDSGRVVRLAQSRYSGIRSGDETIIKASGGYFFENGIAKSRLSIRSEMVELIGYGDESRFYGWVVVRRIHFNTDKMYGRELKIIAQGEVNGYKRGAYINYRTVDGSKMSVQRLSEGRYKISFSRTWFTNARDCSVMLTGYGYSEGTSTAPIKATLVHKDIDGIIVDTSDNETRNDGSFIFYISNIDDWAK